MHSSDTAPACHLQYLHTHSYIKREFVTTRGLGPSPERCRQLQVRPNEQLVRTFKWTKLSLFQPE